MHLDDFWPPCSRDRSEPRIVFGASAVEDPRRETAEKPERETDSRPAGDVSRARPGKGNLLDQRAAVGDDGIDRLLVLRAEAYDPDLVAIYKPCQELGRRLRTVSQVQSRRDRRTNQQAVRTGTLSRFSPDYESFTAFRAGRSLAAPSPPPYCDDRIGDHRGE
jgi:hypothetical protein